MTRSPASAASCVSASSCAGDIASANPVRTGADGVPQPELKLATASRTTPSTRRRTPAQPSSVSAWLDPAGNTRTSTPAAGKCGSTLTHPAPGNAPTRTAISCAASARCSGATWLRSTSIDASNAGAASAASGASARRQGQRI